MPQPPSASLTATDVARLLSAMGRSAHRDRFFGRLRGPRDLALVRVLLFAGARPGELGGLARGAVARTHRDAVCVEVWGRGGCSRSVEVGGVHGEALLSYRRWLQDRWPGGAGVPESDLPLLPAIGAGDGGGLSAASSHRIWAEALAAAGLEHRPPGAARAYFAQELLAQTGDLDLVRRRLGVKTLRSARRWCGGRLPPGP